MAWFKQHSKNPSNRLWDAVIQNDSEKVIKAINDGASVSKIDELGYTPLHAAVSKDSYDIAKLLIDNGAWLTRSAHGQTPLELLRPESDKRLSLLLSETADKQLKVIKKLNERYSNANGTIKEGISETWQNAVKKTPILATTSNDIIREFEQRMDGNASQEMKKGSGISH